MDPGPVKMVKSTNAEWDIEFRVKSPSGKKRRGWFITFSDGLGICPMGLDFPEFLSIRAFDEPPPLDVGGAHGADKWEIGTLVRTGEPGGQAEGTVVERLACLSKAKGGPPDEFVGFFSMRFRYTIDIIR